VKDKLWFFGSLRYNKSDVRFVNFPSGPQYTAIKSGQTKWTYNLTANNKLIGFYNHNSKVQPAHFSSKNQIYDAVAPQDEDFPIGQWKAEYNAVLSPAMFLEARVGWYAKTFQVYSIDPTKPRYFDSARLTNTGGDFAQYQTDERPQTN